MPFGRMLDYMQIDKFNVCKLIELIGPLKVNFSQSDKFNVCKLNTSTTFSVDWSATSAF